MAKGKIKGNQGILPSIVEDLYAVLTETKIMIEECLKPVNVGKVAVKKKSSA